MINLIVACDNNGGIGLYNKLPWPKLKEDMQWFRKHTTGHICVMGSNTWRSLPESYRPLPDRVNVVYTSKSDKLEYKDALIFNGGRIEAAIAYLKQEHPNKNVFVIGGKRVFEQWLPYVERIHLTTINKTFHCDTFIDINTHLINSRRKYNKQVSGNISYTLETYECNNT